MNAKEKQADKLGCSIHQIKTVKRYQKELKAMKTYSVSLTLTIEAKNEQEAKKEFWSRVDDIENDVYINNDSLSVERED